MSNVMILVIEIAVIAIGIATWYFIIKRNAIRKRDSIIAEAQKQAEVLKQEKIIEAKENSCNIKLEQKKKFNKR